MKRMILIIFFTLMVSGCVSESGNWGNATVISIAHKEGNFVNPSSDSILFKDASGNILQCWRQDLR